MDDVVVRLSPEIIMHREFYDKATTRMLQLTKAQGKISLAEFRDLLGTSRKYAVALLDYYDRIGITVRQGDYRVRSGKEV